MSSQMSSVRLSRLNSLVMEFFHEPRRSREHLLAALGYGSNGRALERDLKFLRDEFGVRIWYNRRTRLYEFHGNGSFILQLQMNRREVISIAAGLNMVCHFLPHLGEDCSRFWGKLKSMLPGAMAEQGEKLAESTVVALPVSRMDPMVFETVINAVSDRRRIHFQYESPYSVEGRKQRRISPWGVFFLAHAWYVWGSHSERDEPRTYRISRISSVFALDDGQYSPPPEGQDTRSFASSAWYGCSGGARHKVAVRVRAPLASVVEETDWHPTQRIEHMEDGSITISAVVPDLGEIGRWVMASAPYAEVLEPLSLRESISALCAMVHEGHS
ncbi:MAG TPA: WYL domain-containing protein [Synergistales bacterium]|nr:WYL domain-containing protein [Synergistaceae bacterium]HOI81223.1 WYL domain-containing protein [Synergistales bacterium]HOP52377.1 WYL domain-containing protein [Synergistales bacterium]